MARKRNDDLLPAELDDQARASLRYALNQVFSGNSARIDEWLNAPVVMFEGRSPLELIEAGEAHRVMRALASHDSGVIE
jgi:uncharacterized protein (DUF2384 family)